jgi:tetratricopeptide (TPR) repeat protein
VSIKENTTATSKILTPRPRTPASKSPNRKLKTPKVQNQKNTVGNLQWLKDGSQPLIKILRSLAKCYGHLMRYECEEAIDAIHSLTPAQFSSPWVVGLLAQAHFEKGDYEEAVRHFGTLHENYPHHLSALPFYSTALWHLQRETELSSLSSDLVTTARNHPATWITMGNTFSLHKEHETASNFLNVRFKLILAMLTAIPSWGMNM